MKFLHVFKFKLRCRTRFSTIMLERRGGVDGFDSLQLKKEWSIKGRERVFSVTVPGERSASKMLPGRHYEIYTMTSDTVTGKHNLALAALTTEDPVHITTEIIVARRSLEKGRFADMGIAERKTAESIAIS